MTVKRKVSALLLALVCVVMLAMVNVSAATYSKTQSKKATDGPCSATYSVTATYNTGGNTRWSGNYGISNVKNSAGYIIVTRGLDINYNGLLARMGIKYNSKNLNTYTETSVQTLNYNFKFTGNSVITQ